MADCSRRWPRGLVLAAALAVSSVLAGCDARAALIPTPTPEPTVEVTSELEIVCPESLLSVVQAAAATYQRDHPQVAITVLQGADGMALSALDQGDADMALVSWLPEALPDEAWVRPISRDGLAVVVNPQNGLPGLTMAQLKDLYQGRLADWETWGGLPGRPQLVSRETASGEYAFFQAWVMQDARVSLNALMAPTSEAVLQFVSEDALAVGYVSSAKVDGRVRAVAIEGVPPHAEMIAAGLYPLTRTHFAVVPQEPTDALRGFAQWLLEPPGQEFLSAYGFVPVSE